MTAIISETNNVSKAMADKVLKLYFEPERGVLPREGEIDLSALAQVIAMMAEADVTQNRRCLRHAVSLIAMSARGRGQIRRTRSEQVRRYAYRCVGVAVRNRQKSAASIFPVMAGCHRARAICNASNVELFDAGWLHDR